MRTKEINQALELLEKIKISESMNVYIGVKDVKKVNTLIQYIEELEEDNNKLRKERKSLEEQLYLGEENYVSKDKVKELKEKVHKTLDANGITRAYQMFIDKDFEELLGE